MLTNYGIAQTLYYGKNVLTNVSVEERLIAVSHFNIVKTDYYIVVEQVAFSHVVDVVTDTRWHMSYFIRFSYPSFTPFEFVASKEMHHRSFQSVLSEVKYDVDYCEDEDATQSEEPRSGNNRINNPSISE